MARSRKNKTVSFSNLIKLKDSFYTKQFAGYIRSIHNSKVSGDFTRDYLLEDVSDKFYRNVSTGVSVGLNNQHLVKDRFLSKKNSKMIVFNCFYTQPISVLSNEVMVKTKENIIRMEFEDQYFNGINPGNYNKFKFIEAQGNYFIQVDLNSKKKSVKNPLKMTREKCCRNVFKRKLYRLERGITESERYQDSLLRQAAQEVAVIKFRNDIIQGLNAIMIYKGKEKPLSYDHSRTINESSDNQATFNYVMECVDSIYDKKKEQKGFFKAVMGDLFNRRLTAITQIDFS